MNYRHAYHAGNFADVFKHGLLAMCLEHLKGKDKPFFVLDTHGGIGLYDLGAAEAEKTGEWHSGIERLMNAADIPAELTPYLDVVRGLNPEGGLQHYPGSPWVAKALTRPGDRISLCELHPEDAAVLRTNMRRDRRVKVFAQDGYSAVKSMLPPPERRGLVLIDPPYEQRDEFAALEQALLDGVKRFAGGTFALWYPIKDPLEISNFHARLQALEIPKTLSIDLTVRRSRPGMPRLDGCGYVFINPPYGLLAGLERVMPFLSGLLAQEDGAGWKQRWLVPEA
jgi:23S rRNA (adenine2030-N6)-methyltransferase